MLVLLHANSSASFISPALRDITEILLTGEIPPPSRDWSRCTISNDSNYDFTDFGLKDICALADRINPGGISTLDGNLSAFEKRAGKLITYHGRRDEYIASRNSKRVYNLISESLSMPSLVPFYCLFLVPGKDHYRVRGYSDSMGPDQRRQCIDTQ
ncbi:hypothetical protein FPV67DRAFT_1667721 [Lyophyllum atratum]|nr:hypothetical protein FPV67DRAFT_1667721 [Lyophyllum atratum]